MKNRKTISTQDYKDAFGRDLMYNHNFILLIALKNAQEELVVMITWLGIESSYKYGTDSA